MDYVHQIIAFFAAFLAGLNPQPVGHAREAMRPAAHHVVVLSAGDISRLGIQTVPAQPERFTPRVHGYGVVISLSTVGQTDADISTAQAAARDSRATLDRDRRLYGKDDAEHAISQQALDAAEHQAAANQAQLDLANRKEVAIFGQDAPWRHADHKGDILTQLTLGRVVLVQATFPLSVSFSARPSELTVTRLNAQPGEPNWTSKQIWQGPADPTIPGRSFFALVENTDLAQGEHVLVYAPTGAPANGVAIPSDAVVLSEDKAWCYVFVPPLSFRRVPIDLSDQLPTGYFVAKGIAPNQSVVIKGTGLLLSRELGAATPGEE